MTQLRNKILSFIDNPFPLWENDLTDNLVANELLKLSEFGINLGNYSTAAGYFDKDTQDRKKNILLFGTNLKNSIYLESPQYDLLNEFYEEHGLVPEPESKLGIIEVEKLRDALSVFQLIPECEKCISTIVKSIQVLQQVDDEIDTSYSHPDIPFSIFISLCNSKSVNSDLRVAESILHEAMHLKLTLIEKHVDLIKPNSLETFYSPWRDEQRPLRGVLHGLFVFKGISLLYKELQKIILDTTANKYLKNRIIDINCEFEQLQKFQYCKGLTDFGQGLVINLLQK